MQGPPSTIASRRPPAECSRSGPAGRIVLTAALLAAGCTLSGPELGGPPPPARLDLATAEIVDLSHPYDAETLYWPNMPSGFELEVLARGVTPGGFFYSSNLFSTPEHGGTHLDAPIHFAEGRQSADQVPLERLIGPAVVIDVSEAAAANPDHRLTVGEVEAWEAVHGRVPEGAIVLLRTGWSARWPDRLAYLGDDVPGETSDLHFPAYGEAAARLLVAKRSVAVLGVDTASLDHGPSSDFLVHRVAAEANVPGLENLTNLERLPPKGAWVVALPMKIAGGSGGPARVVALLPPA
ncbi:MAG: cyclase family protein [Thermoanaerobaculia bacterium]|nr:cyclase family protein [Thermoanaerobaculia bacterium]